jgi:hypothetical protein
MGGDHPIRDLARVAMIPTLDFSINGEKCQGNCKISRKLIEIWRKLLSKGDANWHSNPNID